MQKKKIFRLFMQANVMAQILVAVTLFWNLETIGSHIAQETNTLLLHVEFITAIIAAFYFAYNIFHANH